MHAHIEKKFNGCAAPRALKMQMYPSHCSFSTVICDKSAPNCIFSTQKADNFFLGSGIAQHSTGDTLSPAPPVFLGDYIHVYGSSAFSPVGLHTADAGATQLTN